MLKISCKYILLWGLAILLASVSPSRAREGAVGVLLSREIVPYIAMVEGLESEFANRTVQRFFLDDAGRPYSLGGSNGLLRTQDYRVLVGVGPEALRFLWNLAREEDGARGQALVYGMVLDPQKVLPEVERTPCGVSLNIPIESQFAAILEHFPTLRHLGVMFDPANNQAWFEEASSVAEGIGIELVPLQVKSERGKMAIVGDLSFPDAILFIPDKSVISRVVIQYVIKNAFLSQVPVIGYNQFFHDSGAALTFRIDYEQVGRRVATKIDRLLAQKECDSSVPPFDVMVNEDVLRALRAAKGNRPARREVPAPVESDD